MEGRLRLANLINSKINFLVMSLFFANVEYNIDSNHGHKLMFKLTSLHLGFLCFWIFCSFIYKYSDKAHASDLDFLMLTSFEKRSHYNEAHMLQWPRNNTYSFKFDCFYC